jgi:hypothetical protein
MLAAACVGFGTEIWEEVEGPSMWIGTAVTIQVEGKKQFAIGSQGRQDLKAIYLESFLKIMERVAWQEDYCSEDFFLRVLGWKGWVTRAEKAVGLHVKPRPSHMALLICSGVMKSVGKKQCSETNVMHFLLRINGVYVFRALHALPQEVLHKWHLVYWLLKLVDI